MLLKEKDNRTDMEGNRKEWRVTIEVKGCVCEDEKTEGVHIKVVYE